MAAGRRRDPLQPDTWLQLAVRYLARRDHTAAQVEQFLLHRGASPAQAGQAVARLSALRYLDDRAYAARWIAGRLDRRPMGRERVRAELLVRGVTEPVADRAVRAAFRDRDEAMLARRVLAQRRGRRLTPAQAVRLLRQRGFDDDTIDRLIGDRFGNEGADEQ